MTDGEGNSNYLKSIHLKNWCFSVTNLTPQLITCCLGYIYC